MLHDVFPPVSGTMVAIGFFDLLRYISQVLVMKLRFRLLLWLHLGLTYPVYMIKTKVVFLEGQLFSSQSKLFEYFSNCFAWLVKSRPFKKATFVLIM